MAIREVKIRDDEEYITLNVLLKITGLIQTGGEAKWFLADNDVYVNGEKENRRGRKLYRDDVIKANKDEFVIKYDKSANERINNLIGVKKNVQ